METSWLDHPDVQVLLAELDIEVRKRKLLPEINLQSPNLDAILTIHGEANDRMRPILHDLVELKRTLISKGYYIEYPVKLKPLW